MSRFYEFGFDGRLVNLDHVRTINVRRDEDRHGRQGYSTFVRYADDSSETFRSGIEHNLAYHTAPIVPANPGFERLSFWFYDEEGYEPAADEAIAIHNRTPIVAWRLLGDSPEAIAVDSFRPNGDEGLLAILRPDGVVYAEEGQSFENLNEWAAHVCKRWRLWRDAKHKGVAA